MNSFYRFTETLIYCFFFSKGTRNDDALIPRKTFAWFQDREVDNTRKHMNELRCESPHESTRQNSTRPKNASPPSL
jgi:hypothetical protein